MTDLPAPERIALPPHELTHGGRDPGITLSVHQAGEGPAVVLCHGFPELAYSWRHQIPALAEAGFRVIAPDQRGYGDSDRPEPIEAYDIHHLTGDLVALLDALGIERAVFVGHDWGGIVVWAMPLLHPTRTAGVVGVNTPYLPRGPVSPIELMRRMAAGDDDRIYILWFQKPGVADEVLASQTRLVFEKLMRAAGGSRALEPEAREPGGPREMNPFRGLPEMPEYGRELLRPEELDHYVRVFERTGFTGGLNWYRNFHRNWETTPQLENARIEAPSLMITAERDPVLRPEMAASMPALVPDLETVMIQGCGHWTQQERPEELNRILIDWLRRRFQ